MNRFFRTIFRGETAAKEGIAITDNILQRMQVVEVEYDAKELTLPPHVKLSTEFYVEVAPGVLDRILEGPNDIKYKFEEPFREQIAKVDFGEGTQVIVRSAKGGHFVPHWHRRKEIIRALSGSYYGWVGSDETFGPGDIQVIPARKVHRYDIASVGPDGYQYSIITLFKEEL